MCENHGSNIVIEEVNIPEVGKFIKNVCQYCGETIQMYNANITPEQIEHLKNMYNFKILL